VHHYYPALYFAILTAGFCVDWATRKLPRPVYYGVYAILYTVIIALFILFIPISFGMSGPNQQWKHLNWFARWKIAN